MPNRDLGVFPVKLAIVAIMKNEEEYLKEWLDYHLAAGVERFYIYNNESTDNSLAILAPYVRQGLAVVMDVKGTAQQYPAYNNAIRYYRYEAKYMAFIDLDEFIVPRVNRPLPEMVEEVFAKDDNIAAIGINWRMFGSSGLTEAPQSCLEGFTRRGEDNMKNWELDILQNSHIKSIVNPRRVRFFANPHFAFYMLGCVAVDMEGEPIRRAITEKVKDLPLVIHHYHAQTRGQWEKRHGRPRADNGTAYKKSWYEMADRNDLYDDSALRYLEYAKGFSPAPKVMPPRKLELGQRLLVTFSHEKGTIPYSTEELAALLAYALRQDATWEGTARLLALGLLKQASASIRPWEAEIVLELMRDLEEKGVFFAKEVKERYLKLVRIMVVEALRHNNLCEAIYLERHYVHEEEGEDEVITKKLLFYSFCRGVAPKTPGEDEEPLF